MIRVIIADDDIEMLEGLEHLINWEDFGFTVVGKADNGNTALDLINELLPDVLITDIAMPFFDGLTLIEKAKEVLPNIKTVILTCHEDFHYAKEAVRLQADEYIVKYTLEKDELIKVILKIREKIEKELRQEEYANEIYEQLHRNKHLLRGQLFRDLLIKSDSKYIYGLFCGSNVLGIKLPESDYRVIGMFFDDLSFEKGGALISQNDLTLDDILDIIENNFVLYGNIQSFLYKNNAILSLFWEEGNLPFHIQKLVGALMKIQAAVFEQLSCKPSVCIGDVNEGLENLSGAVDKVYSLRDAYFYTGTGSIVYENERYSRCNVEKLFGQIQPELLTILGKKDYNALFLLLDGLFKTIKDEKFSPESVRNLFSKIHIDIEIAAGKYGISLRDFNIAEASFETCKEKLLGLAHDFMRAEDSKAALTSRTEIKKVLEYMKNNMNTDITCNNMAAYVNLNSSYFSRLFKNEIGIPFTDYLLKIRIERAAALLSISEMPVKEIVDTIGIENESYFYRVFKKVTGKTPGEIRGAKKSAV